jgi:hypothetical protein
VSNAFFDIRSLRSPGIPAAFDFIDRSFTILSQGGGYYDACASTPCLTRAGNTVTGQEANGTLEFDGPITSISWTTPDFESWYGFTVGVDDIAAVSVTPEPSSLFLISTGLLGVASAMRRRRRRK